MDDCVEGKNVVDPDQDSVPSTSAPKGLVTIIDIDGVDTELHMGSADPGCVEALPKVLDFVQYTDPRTTSMVTYPEKQIEGPTNESGDSLVTSSTEILQYASNTHAKVLKESNQFAMLESGIEDLGEEGELDTPSTAIPEIQQPHDQVNPMARLMEHSGRPLSIEGSRKPMKNTNLCSSGMSSNPQHSV